MRSPADEYAVARSTGEYHEAQQPDEATLDRVGAIHRHQRRGVAPRERLEARGAVASGGSPEAQRVDGRRVRIREPDGVVAGARITKWLSGRWVMQWSVLAGSTPQMVTPPLAETPTNVRPRGSHPPLRLTSSSCGTGGPP